MVTATTKETRQKLNKLLARAEKGEEVFIQRGSTVVATIQPVDDWDKPLLLTDEEAERLHRYAKEGPGMTFESMEAAIKYMKRRFSKKR